ncbi:MAG: MgtC/SapB family protein [archaeon]
MVAVTILLKFCITLILALIYGLARQKAHKPIGFGTFVFVSTGACALSISAIMIQKDNPLPLLGAIITGIGFLGAGALIKTSDKIFGFTSAASIWVFAIFGLLIGVGEYLPGMLVYVMVWLVMVFDKYLENRGIGSYQRKMVINTNKIVPEKDIDSLIAIGSVKFKKTTIELNKKDNTMTMTYLIEGKKEDINSIPQRLYEKPWFSSFKVD